jgi:aspartate kinase
MSTLVMKFGGSLTADARHLTRVAQVITAESLAWPRMVVVVSAMAGATNALSMAVDLAAERNALGYRHQIADLRANHVRIVTQLFPTSPLQEQLIGVIDRWLTHALLICDRVAAARSALPRDRDAVMAVGEQIMSHLVAELARQEGVRAALVDATAIIITDGQHQNAHPILDVVEVEVERILRPLLDARIVPIVAGFIGAASKTGAITTLGRGGSDLTATILASALRADEVWLWTNVEGVMSADPDYVPGARVIGSLSYEEISELSYFGVRVLHPAAIEPLAAHGIPLRVRNPFNLDHAGTLIQAESGDSNSPLKAVTAVDGLYLSARNHPLDLTAFLGKVHQVVGNTATGPVIAMQGYGRATLVFVVPTSAGPNAAEAAAAKLAAELPKWDVQPVKVVAVIGAGGGRGFPNDLTITPLASVSGPQGRRLVAVRPSDAKATVRSLYKLTESAPPPSQIWPRRT